MGPQAPAPAPYGQRTMIRYHNDPNFCLSVEKGKFVNGQNIQLWQCEGSTPGNGQYFRVDPQRPGMIVLDEDPRYCVVIDGNKDENGANIQLWECGGLTVQEWRYENQLFRNMANDKCIVVDSNQAYNGNNVRLWSCSGREEIYMWSLSTQPTPQAPAPAPYGQRTMIRYHNDPNFCLSVEKGKFVNGQNIQLWQCEGSTPGNGQYFRVDPQRPGMTSWTKIRVTVSSLMATRTKTERIFSCGNAGA